MADHFYKIKPAYLKQAELLAAKKNISPDRLIKKVIDDALKGMGALASKMRRRPAKGVGNDEAIEIALEKFLQGVRHDR